MTNLTINPIQIRDPLDQAGKALQLKQLVQQGQLGDFKLGEEQRGLFEQRTIADLMRRNLAPDGQVNHQGVVQGMASAGLGDRIPKYQKAVADADKSVADVANVKSQTSKHQLEAAKMKVEATGAAIGALIARPNLTPDDIIDTIAGLVRDGYMERDQGAKLVRQIPGSPNGIQAWLQEANLQAVDAKTRMDLMTPKVREIDTGGQKLFAKDNQLTGDVVIGGNAVGTVNKAATPGDILASDTGLERERMGNRTSMRNADVAANTAATAFIETPTGVVVGNKAGPVPTATPLVNSSGNQVQQAKSPLAQSIQTAGKLTEASRVARELLPNSTSSGIGEKIDKIGSFIGISVPGADAAAQLSLLAGWMAINVPRLEGQQSDRDLLLYRQMVGQIGDASLPLQTRMAALDSLDALNKKFSESSINPSTQVGTPGIPRPGLSPVMPSSKAPSPVVAPAGVQSPVVRPPLSAFGGR